jgi:hypothetical protein
MAGAVRIAHLTLRSCVALVECPHKPIRGLLRPCPLCQVVHKLKTVHLWLDDAGTCLVSEGVLADLLKAGMPALAVVGEVADPPPLVIGQERQVVDSRNRRIVRWEPVHA